MLHHATYVRMNPNVIILGGLGGHGKHTLNAANWFIGQSDILGEWWVGQEYGMGRIRSKIHEDTRGVILVSSAGRRIGGRGGTSQEGEAPTLVVVEELHRHEDNGAAVRTLTTKVQKRTVGKHNVRIVHVTTAGDSLESVLGRMEKRATAPGSKVEHPLGHNYYTRAIDPDADLVMHRWAVPEDIEAPPTNCSNEELDAYLDNVKMANPATFITKRNLRRIWKASTSEIWIFLRQCANQWVTQNLTAFKRYDIKRCLRRGLSIPPTEDTVYVGLDTATAFATTALAPVWINPVSGKPVSAGGVIRKSEHKGQKRRMRDVVDVLDMMRRRWPNMVLVFDRNWGGGLLAEQFEEDHGMQVVDHGQGTPMEFASMLLGELISQHVIEIEDNAEAVAHMAAATARPTYYGKRWRLEKPRTGEPIDFSVALAMAVNAAKQAEESMLDVDEYHVEGL